MMKRIIFILILLGCTISYADEAVSVDEIKAAFIYHFIGFVQWRDEGPECDVCIPDDNDLRAVAQQSLQGKVVNGRTINVVNRYDHCNVLVAQQYPPAQQSPATGSVLTIGPLANGSLMEFRIVDNKLRFAVNLEKLKSSKLKISSQLLKLAILENV